MKSIGTSCQVGSLLAPRDASTDAATYLDASTAICRKLHPAGGFEKEGEEQGAAAAGGVQLREGGLK
eukprot:683317-Pelagomonas_calceolata.AAC.2